MNAQLKSSLGQYLDINRVVEVASGFGINGNRVAFSEVVAAHEILFGERIGQGRRFLFGLVWKTDWQAELLYDDVRFDVRIVEESNDRHHFAGRPSCFARKPRDLDFDNLVLVLGDIVGNQDFLGQLEYGVYA